MNDKAVELHSVSKSYSRGSKKTEVLHNISLQVAQGEFVAVTGPSGSGKSTLVRLIGLLDTTNRGTVKLFGEKLPRSDRALSKLRNSSIGFVFQDYRLIPHHSVLENIVVPLKIAGLSRSAQKKRAYDLLRLVKLDDFADAKAGELSGGQQQRVGIARALIMQPKLLIADEPTGNLDSVTGASIMQILHSIHKRLGVTIIIVTHSDTIAGQTQRIITLKDGLIGGAE